MTNYSGDGKENESSRDKRLDQIDLAILRLPKTLQDKLKEISLLFSNNEGSKLSIIISELLTQKLNPLINSSVSLEPKPKPNNLQTSDTSLVPNVSDDTSEEDDEDGYEEEYEDECDEESYKNSFNRDDHLLIDDPDGDDDARAYFPCPFCYIEIEVHVLCSHLQDEHCFDLKNAVCPICAANLGRDVIGHFIVQHASSLKRRRKSLKSGPWTGSSAMVNKELSLFLGSSTNNRTNVNETAPDPLLSPFLGDVSDSHSERIEQNESCNRSAHSASSETSSHGGGNELDSEERRQRATFVQQLIASTIF